MNNQNFLLDKDFLKKLDAYPRREVYARITSLTFDEQPIECIEGRITGGSINIDGASSVRRTCSLSLVTEKLNINDYIWGIRTKFHLEVGLKNEINKNYPDICWFNLGYYVTTSFTSSINTNSRTISIQGKDKMCLLNGDLGGSLPSIIDFGREEWYDYDYEKVLVDETIFIETLGQLDYINDPFYIMTTNSETQEKEPHDIPASEIDNWQAYEKQTFYKKLATYTPIVVDKKTYKASTYYIKQENKQTKEQEYILADGSFDEKETYYKKEIKTNYHIKPLLIKKIIKEGVHAWGGEAYHNIIINDLDTYGMEQLTYRDNAASDDDEETEEKPLYIIKNLDNDTFQVTLTDMTVWREDGIIGEGHQDGGMNLSQLSPENSFIFDTGIIDATKVKLSHSSNLFNRTVLRVNDTEDAGYRITDLTYVPEDGLTSSVGESFTSILDKIKNLLDDFEYFYNLDGQFVFQRKKTYTNVNFSSVHNIDLENLYVDATALAEPVTYDFSDNFLISAININPTLTNVKNDYAIQGKRTTASGAEVPIHLRYAIDKKPVYYKAIDGTTYISSEYYNTKDWERDKIKKTLKRISLSTHKISDVSSASLKIYRNSFWTYIKTEIKKIYFNENNEPTGNTLWDLHHNKWKDIENFYFQQKDLLQEGIDGIYQEDLDNAIYNIKYKAGWWDLEAWQKFYEIVSQQPANKNLVLYSAHTKNKNENSRSWNSFFRHHYYKYQAWRSSSDYAPIEKNINDRNDRIFIFTTDNIYSTERDAPWGTIEPIYPHNTTIQEYETSHFYTEVIFESPADFALRGDNCYTASTNPPNIYTDLDFEQVSDSAEYDPTITYYQRKYNVKPSEIDSQLVYFTLGYPEIFGIDKSWTYDLAVQKLIPKTNSNNKAAWIFNPQFPEGSFEEAFSLGVKTYKDVSSPGYKYFYATEVQVVDWRELIYQMSKDYLKYAMSDNIVTQTEFQKIGDGSWEPYGPGETVSDQPLEERLTWRDIFITAIMKNNPDYYPTGITGYEQYYTDINAFWRSCYNSAVTETLSFIDSDFYTEISINSDTAFANRDKSNCYIKNNEDQYIAVDTNASFSSGTQYYRRLKLWKSDYFFSQDDIDNIFAAQNYGQDFDPRELTGLYKSDELRGWNYKLYFQPTALDFWFDFLDEGEVAQNYGVKVIGLRTKAVNNDKVSAVYFTKLPTICFYTAADSENWKKKTDEQVMRQSGYTFALLPPGLENNFQISSRQLSAKDYLDSLLYQFSYVPEQLSITALPIYYLEPNTRIYVHDEETAIDGEYIINKITLPLTYNGTMSITANKAPERII